MDISAKFGSFEINFVAKILNFILLGSNGSGGLDISGDSDSNSIFGKTGNSKLRLLDSMKPKKLGAAPSGSKHGSKEEQLCMILMLVDAFC